MSDAAVEKAPAAEAEAAAVASSSSSEPPRFEIKSECTCGALNADVKVFFGFWVFFHRLTELFVPFLSCFCCKSAAS